MNLKKISCALVLASFLLPMTWSGSALAGKSEDVAIVTNNLGYGAGIHKFKNYVIRGGEKNKTIAVTAFNNSKAALANLSKDKLTADEKKAVADITGVVDKYLAAIEKVSTLKAQKKTAKEIDAVVKINDAPAINGLNVLVNSTGAEASKLQMSLGFGGAIHQFKNYVLRGKAKHGANATTLFNAANKEADNIADASAKKAVKDVIGKYLAAIGKIDSMVAAKKTPEQIDAAIKISDAAAVKALSSAKL